VKWWVFKHPLLEGRKNMAYESNDDTLIFFLPSFELFPAFFQICSGTGGYSLTYQSKVNKIMVLMLPSFA
jgi:hypothetical protein